jgi:hypothetical protein
VHCSNLACAIRVLIEATDKTVYDEARMMHPLCQLHKVFAASTLEGPRGEAQDCFLFRVGQDGAAGKPVEERLEIG